MTASSTGSRRTTVGLVCIGGLAIAGLALGILLQHSMQLATGIDKGYWPLGGDSQAILIPAHALAHWQRPPLLWDSRYPAPTYVLYVVFGFLPSGFDTSAALLISVALVVWSLRAWSHMRISKVPVLAIILSAPVVFCFQLVQINTAVGLAAVTAAYIAQTKNRPLIAGLLFGIALCRITNGLPTLAAVLPLALYRNRPIGMRLLLGTLLTVVPATIVASLWEPNWWSSIGAVGVNFPLTGGPDVARSLIGSFGPSFLLVCCCGITLAIAMLSPTAVMTRSRYAVILALSLIATHLNSVYVAVFALPALLVLSEDNPRWAWLTVIAMWLAYIVTVISIIPSPGNLSESAQMIFKIWQLSPLILSITVASGLALRGLAASRLATL